MNIEHLTIADQRNELIATVLDLLTLFNKKKNSATAAVYIEKARTFHRLGNAREAQRYIVLARSYICPETVIL